jgi:predicted transcriptional regulator
LKVRVEDVALTYVKPKITQIVWQYIIVTSDEFMHSEVFIVDAEKVTKEAVEQMIKKKYAARYRIPEGDIEVVWTVELPKITRS